MTLEPGRAVEQRLRAAVESVPSGIIMVDAGGTIVLVNREIERLFGYSREELLGHSIDLLVPARVRDRHKDFRASFFLDPRSRAMGAGRDLHGQRKDGTEVPVEVGLTPVFTDQGIFVVGAVVDISARKRAEAEHRVLEEQLRQSQKLQAVGTLAGGIAHDFNNILAAIVGFAELVQLAVADRPHVVRDMAEVLKSAAQGKHLVEQILAFSRRQPQRKCALSLSDPLRDAKNLLRASLPPGIDIRATIVETPPRVLADPTSVHQVVMNLGTNGAHAMMGQGTLELSVEAFYARDSFVRTHPALREAEYTVLTVRDTGCGMDPALLERVFEPFFTTKAPGAGTGLGLSMVHSIMREHDGAIYLESEVGHGTTARCYFPSLVNDTPEIVAPISGLVRGSGERILYVDDDVALVEVGRRRLVSLGYSVVPVSDTSEALAAVKAEPDAFDMVITDYWMPKMRGTELAAAIHAVAPELPIVMLTGLNEDLPAELLAASGILEVVQKPVTIRQLGDTVAATLAARGKPRA